MGGMSESERKQILDALEDGVAKEMEKLAAVGLYQGTMVAEILARIRLMSRMAVLTQGKK